MSKTKSADETANPFVNPEVENFISLADQIPGMVEAYRAGTVNLSQVQDLVDAVKASAKRIAG